MYSEKRRTQINVNLTIDGDQIGQLADRLSTDPPQQPPCEGGVWMSWGVTTKCVAGVVHFIDTVVWRCPDGTTQTVTSDTATDPPVPC